MNNWNLNAREFVPRAATTPSTTATTMPTTTSTPAAQSNQTAPVPHSSFSTRMYELRNDIPAPANLELFRADFQMVPEPETIEKPDFEPLPSPSFLKNETFVPIKYSPKDDYTPTPDLDNYFSEHDNTARSDEHFVDLTKIDNEVKEIENDLKKIGDERKILKDFEGLIKILNESPAEFDSACEYIVYLISAHLKSRAFIKQLVTILITVAWDVNFHYSAANLSKKLDIISPIYKEELLEAINSEMNGEISNLTSFSLLISEMFYVFDPEMFPQFHRCLRLLVNNNTTEKNMKTACKMLKLNGASFFKQHPDEYNSIAQQIIDQKPNFTQSTQDFIGRTFKTIETMLLHDSKTFAQRGQMAAEAAAQPQLDVSAEQSQLQLSDTSTSSSNQSDSLFSFLTNAGDNDFVGALNMNHDSGIGGVIYGPDRRPLTQEELNFLRVSDDVSINLENLIQSEMQTAFENSYSAIDHYNRPN